MNRRRSVRRAIAAAAPLALIALLLAPGTVLGHAIGQVFTLPVPLWLYLAGAALAVAASFVISALTLRPAGPVPAYPTATIPAGVVRAASIVLQVIGLIWWAAAIWLGYTVDSLSPFPAVLLWIGIWVALPISAVLLGNSWPSLSPFRTLHGLLDRLVAAISGHGLRPWIAYPAGLRRWPAVALLFAGLWSELILPESSAPTKVATLLLGYTLLTMAGTLVFGRVAWLRNAELFEVLLGWFGRVGPIGRRAVEPEVCDGCMEACDPAHCVDCPECLTASEPGELQLELRPWFVGLTEVRGSGWSDAAFIVLALAGVSFDGLKETAFWGSLLEPVFNAVWDALGALNAVLVVQTAGLLAVWMVFLAAFTTAAWLTRRLHDPGRSAPLGHTAGTYAATLLPIAGGYLIAHYLTLVIQGFLWLPGLVVNSVDSVAPSLGWIPTSAIWYLSVAAIVVGHIVAVVLAHRLALRDAASRPVVAGLPLVTLMVSYTVFSLWIIAAPITVEPSALRLILAGT
jgi:hypothetical protein